MSSRTDSLSESIKHTTKICLQAHKKPSEMRGDSWQQYTC